MVPGGPFRGGAGIATLRLETAIIAKPGIAAGVAAAGFAGMTLAARDVPPASTVLICLFCIISAASGSAIMNVLLERDTDALMPRVERRLSALNGLGHDNALAIAGSLIISGVLVSLVFLGALTAALVAAASGSYIFLYTLYHKKRSPYGTVTGGIPGALPVLIGYSSIGHGIGMDGVILFLVLLLWQPPHFLPLALKYRQEYKAAGIPVMPVAFGEGYTRIFIFIYAAALIPLTLSLFIFGYCSVWFGGAALALGFVFLLTYYVNLVREHNYGRAFGVSILYMMSVLAGIVIDIWVRSAGLTA